MTTTFQERLHNAAIFLQEDRLEDSISEYSEALQQATTPEQKIDLYKVLGRLYQRSKKPKEAISAFEASLQLYPENKEESSLSDRAAVHNNLASVLLSADVSRAILNYQKALEIYESLMSKGTVKYASHLGNTHFALAEALMQEGKPGDAKKHFKEAIKIYENLPDLAEFQARAHYQMGIIYTDEFNLHDAKTQYTKAIRLYESLSPKTGTSGMAIMAALHNNLGVTYNDMEEREKAVHSYQHSLEFYRKLAETHAEVFLPYEAATLTSLGITYAGMQQMPKAIEHMQGSIDRYHELSDAHPEQYTHYLATALHNQGLFFFEQKELDKAEHFFSQALALRRNMASEEPDLFGPDACATALNLIELFQIRLEATLDLSLQEQSLQLLEEVNTRLSGLEDDRLVIKNMRADCASFLDYFREINTEELSVNYVKLRANALREEIHGTIDPSEKLVFQKELTELLEEQQSAFSANRVLTEMLALAHNDMSWLLLRLKRPQEARKHIEAGEDLDPELSLLQCNLGHCYLQENDLNSALSAYSDFLASGPENSVQNREMLKSDLEVLRRAGTEKNRIEQILSALSA